MALNVGDLEVLLKMRDEMAPVIQSAVKNLDLMQKEVVELSKKVDSMESTVRKGADAIANSSERLQRWGSNAVIAGAAMSQLTGPILGWGQSAIKVAGDFERTKIAFTNMLGSGQAAAAFLKDLEAFAARTPFEFPDLTSAAQKLMAMGFSAQQVIPTMTAIGDAVAGVGGSTVEIDRVVRALGQMQAKGKITAEEMMQIAETNIPAWRILAKELGISVPEAMSRAAKGAIDVKKGIDALIQGMGKEFPNMMEQQSRSFQGMMSTLRDNIGFVARDIGSALLPALSQIVKFLGEKVVPLLQVASRWFAALPAPVRLAAAGFVALIAAIGPLLILVGGLAGAWGAALPIFAAVAAAMSGPLGIALAVFAVIAALAGLIVAMEGTEGASQMLVDLWTSLSYVARELWSVLGPVQVGFLSALAESLRVLTFGTVDAAAAFRNLNLLGDSLRLTWLSLKNVTADVAIAMLELYKAGLLINPLLTGSTDTANQYIAGLKLLKEGYAQVAGQIVDGNVPAQKDLVDVFEEEAQAAIKRNQVTRDVEKWSKEAEKAAKKQADEFKRLVDTYRLKISSAAQVADATKKVSAVLAAIPPVAKLTATELGRARVELSQLGEQGRKAAEKLTSSWQEANGVMFLVSKNIKDLKPPTDAAVVSMKSLSDVKAELVVQATKLYVTDREALLVQQALKQLLDEQVIDYARYLALGGEDFRQTTQLTTAKRGLSAVVKELSDWLRKAADELLQLADVLYEVGDAVGGTVGKFITAIADLAAGLGKGAKAADDFAAAKTRVGKAVAVANVAVTAYKGGVIQGAAAGAAFGASFGPIGIAIGAVAGGLLGFIGKAKAAQEAMRKMREEFIASVGGMAALIAKAKEAGIALDALFKAKNAEALKKAIDDIKKGLDTWNEAQEKLADAIKRYGFTIDELGPAWRAQELDKMAQQLYQDYMLLVASGIDVVNVIKRMGPALQEYVMAAIKAGVAIPSAMKPIIDEMIRQGLLLNENGEAYKSAEEAGIKYADSLSEGMQKVVDAVDRLIKALMRIAGIGEINVGVNINTKWKGPKIPGDNPDNEEPSGYGNDDESPGNVPGGQGAASGFFRASMPWGPLPGGGTPLVVHPRERVEVIPANENTGGGGVGGRGVVLYYSPQVTVYGAGNDAEINRSVNAQLRENRDGLLTALVDSLRKVGAVA